ncbi:MAG: ABC transporter permease, partial [Acidobacteria bacterium]|nr:ABC transporter permease [Acidobacteriota bacterium]
MNAMIRRAREGRLGGAIESIRFAAGAVVAHKLRSSLTVLGIVIGVTTVVAMVSVIEGFNNSVVESFKSFGATLVQFQKFDPGFGGPHNDEEVRKRKELTWEDAKALKALVPAMAAVSPERYWFGGPDSVQTPDVIYAGREATPDQFAGVTEDYAVANNRTIGEGRFINATDVLHSSPVVVIGYKVMETLFPNVDPIGRIVTISGRSYTVIGVF